MIKRKVCILGSTGSIGKNALKVISALNDKFQVSGLSAQSNVSLLADQVNKFKPKKVAIGDKTKARELQKKIKANVRVMAGEEGVEELKNALETDIRKLRAKSKITDKFFLKLNIEELKRGEISGQVVAHQIASDIERRFPFRLVLRRHLDTLKQNREIQGARLTVAGRLNGAEISRKESVSFGSMPNQTLRANIDYGEATSFNTYGTIGVKVWLHKGEIETTQ